MNIAQREHADTFSEKPPSEETLEKMEDLITARRRELILIKNRRITLRMYDDLEGQMSDTYRDFSNQLTQAQLRLAENLREIVEVAGQIRDEYGAVEILNGRESE